jgi:hypothetical protein
MTTPNRHGRRAHWAAAWLLAAGPAAPAQPVPPLPAVPAVPALPGHLSPISAQPPDASKPPASADPKPLDDPDKKPTDDKDAKEQEQKEKDALEKEKAEAAKLTPLPGQPLGLGECLAIAMERQPRLKAARSSLEASQLGKESLNTVGRLAERLSPDVPVRRQQADRGVAVAQAVLEQVHNESVYDVIRSYWTYVYARQQERTGSDVVVQLVVFRGILEDIIKSGVPGKLNQFTLYTMRDTIAEVRILREEAVTGQKRALGALREAMGVDPAFVFHPKDTELPILEGAVSRDQVVEAAITRRPELAQAAAGVDAFRLEICAQGMIRFRKSVPTLASGSDLHSRQVPMPVRNGEYRPGALAPEMPPNLVGRTESRVARATELSHRQDNVYELTLALVRLEAEDAFTAWEGATAKVREAKARYDNARQFVTQAREVAGTVRQDPQLVITSEAQAGRAQAEYLKAVFEHVKALATLERVTAGAVKPAFTGR